MVASPQDCSFYGKSKYDSVSEWVTRSPIELSWTAKKSDSVFFCVFYLLSFWLVHRNKRDFVFFSPAPLLSSPQTAPSRKWCNADNHSRIKHWIPIIIKFIWDKNYDETIVFFWVGATRKDLKNSISSEALSHSAPHSCKQHFKQAKNNLLLKHRHTLYQIYKAQRPNKTLYLGKKNHRSSGLVRMKSYFMNRD